VRGVGEGFGGAIVRVRVGGAMDGWTVELLLFCASPPTAHKPITEAATTSFFIIGFLQVGHSKIRRCDFKPESAGCGEVFRLCLLCELNYAAKLFHGT
jgi:hypothetical protein